MSEDSALLPGEFRELSRFASWVLPTEKERNAKRLNSSMEEINAFYDAIVPRMDDIGAHLNRFSVEEMPDQERRLFYLALSLMEVSVAVELFHSPDVPFAVAADRLQILSA